MPSERLGLKPAARPIDWMPSARDIWISSAVRGGRSGLHKSWGPDGWIALEFLGFSRPKRAFSMVYARTRAIFFVTRPHSPKAAASRTKRRRSDCVSSEARMKRSYRGFGFSATKIRVIAIPAPLKQGTGERQAHPGARIALTRARRSAAYAVAGDSAAMADFRRTGALLFSTMFINLVF